MTDVAMLKFYRFLSSFDGREDWFVYLTNLLDVHRCLVISPVVDVELPSWLFPEWCKKDSARERLLFAHSEDGWIPVTSPLYHNTRQTVGAYKMDRITKERSCVVYSPVTESDDGRRSYHQSVIDALRGRRLKVMTVMLPPVSRSSHQSTVAWERSLPEVSSLYVQSPADPLKVEMNVDEVMESFSEAKVRLVQIAWSADQDPLTDHPLYAVTSGVWDTSGMVYTNNPAVSCPDFVLQPTSEFAIQRRPARWVSSKRGHASKTLKKVTNLDGRQSVNNYMGPRVCVLDGPTGPFAAGISDVLRGSMAGSGMPESIQAAIVSLTQEATAVGNGSIVLVANKDRVQRTLSDELQIEPEKFRAECLESVLSPAESAVHEEARRLLMPGVELPPFFGYCIDNSNRRHRHGCLDVIGTGLAFFAAHHIYDLTEGYLKPTWT